MAPNASFVCIAHLPETRLCFPLNRPDLGGGLPSVTPDPGHTVWGALFEIPADEASALDAAEAEEGRVPTEGFRAVDREGTTYRVVTHVASGDGEYPPSREYMEAVVAGSRRWELPTGWIAGLEEYVEEPLF